MTVNVIYWLPPHGDDDVSVKIVGIEPRTRPGWVFWAQRFFFSIWGTMMERSGFLELCQYFWTLRTRKWLAPLPGTVGGASGERGRGQQRLLFRLLHLSAETLEFTTARLGSARLEIQGENSHGRYRVHFKLCCELGLKIFLFNQTNVNIEDQQVYWSLWHKKNCYVKWYPYTTIWKQNISNFIYNGHIGRSWSWLTVFHTLYVASKWNKNEGLLWQRSSKKQFSVTVSYTFM